MKRNVSICIFVLGIIIIILLILLLLVPKKKEEQDSENIIVTETEEPTIVSSSIQNSYEYYLLEDQGRLSVYLSDKETLYMVTGIPKWALSEELQQQLENGIGFKSEEELYDFLESYSS